MMTAEVAWWNFSNKADISLKLMYFFPLNRLKNINPGAIIMNITSSLTMNEKGNN